MLSTLRSRGSFAANEIFQFLTFVFVVVICILLIVFRDGYK